MGIFERISSTALKMQKIIAGTVVKKSIYAVSVNTLHCINDYLNEFFITDTDAVVLSLQQNNESDVKRSLSNIHVQCITKL